MELASFINKIRSTSETQASADLKSLGELPRRWGVAAIENGAEILKRVFAHAVKQHIQKKIQLLLKRRDEHDPVELLFQFLFISLDYSPFS